MLNLDCDRKKSKEEHSDSSSGLQEIYSGDRDGGPYKYNRGSASDYSNYGSDGYNSYGGSGYGGYKGYGDYDGYSSYKGYDDYSGYGDYKGYSGYKGYDDYSNDAFEDYFNSAFKDYFDDAFKDYSDNDYSYSDSHSSSSGSEHYEKSSQQGGNTGHGPKRPHTTKSSKYEWYHKSKRISHAGIEDIVNNKVPAVQKKVRAQMLRSRKNDFWDAKDFNTQAKELLKEHLNNIDDLIAILKAFGRCFPEGSKKRSTVKQHLQELKNKGDSFAEAIVSDADSNDDKLRDAIKGVQKCLSGNYYLSTKKLADLLKMRP